MSHFEIFMAGVVTLGGFVAAVGAYYMRVAPKKDNPLAGDIAKILAHVQELHEWHAITDEDGVKKWYNRRSHEEEIRRTGDMMRDVASAMAALSAAVDRLRKDL